MNQKISKRENRNGSLRNSKEVEFFACSAKKKDEFNDNLFIFDTLRGKMLSRTIVNNGKESHTDYCMFL